MYKDSVYLTTPDAHLIAFNAKDGKVRWDVTIADSSRGYWSTNAPLVVGNHVMVGVSGDFDNLPGQLKSIDAETGKTQWIFYSTPPPGVADPPSGGATGGQMWMTGTYDPELNLVYVGTGNPTPVLNGPARPGDNPWTCSIVAINPDTGKLVWGFQVSPHDTHDWDAAEVPVLVDGDFNGTPRKMVMQASRNGYFFVLDRTNGKNLLTTPFATVNWAKEIDKDGRPIPDPAKEPSRDGVLVAPNESGGTNFRSPSFDPSTGLFIVSAHDGYGIYFFKPEHGDYGWAGADYKVAGRGFLRAIDYKTGKIVWSHPIGDGPGTAGVLTTNTGLTFTGDVPGNSWHFEQVMEQRCGTLRSEEWETHRSRISWTASSSSWSAAAVRSTRSRCQLGGSSEENSYEGDFQDNCSLDSSRYRRSLRSVRIARRGSHPRHAPRWRERRELSSMEARDSGPEETTR